MKKILLVRHSIPAKDNTKDTSLLPLSEEGVRLAREKREIFCNVDRCYSSFYKRALQTAEVFSENMIDTFKPFGNELLNQLKAPENTS